MLRPPSTHPAFPAVVALLALATPPACPAAAAPPTTRPAGTAADADRHWVGPMREVHKKFTGQPGTFAHFGDSITVTKAFWSDLGDNPRNLDPAAADALELVKSRMRKECWSDWKGPANGSQGGMQIDWAQKNVDAWLKKLNPEAALILFGTNDLREGRTTDDYAKRLREVVRKCLDNGTVVLLTTPPPRTKKLNETRAYAEAVRAIGREMHVPVVDYFEAVMSRRPDDWDGSQEPFKSGGKDTYDVPTLISRDGVHPSAPKQFAGDYSAEALRHHGYGLRAYVTLLAYADVTRELFAKAR